MSATVYLSRRWRFSASHRLHVDAMDAASNREIFGKCNNPYGHGHNYIVEVTFAGHVDAATGMVTDLAELDRFAQTHVLDRFDHANLNTLECFLDRVPSTENLAIELWSVFAQYPGPALKRVRVEETANNSFEYFGGEVSTMETRA